MFFHFFAVLFPLEIASPLSAKFCLFILILPNQLTQQIILVYLKICFTDLLY